ARIALAKGRVPSPRYPRDHLLEVQDEEVDERRIALSESGFGEGRFHRFAPNFSEQSRPILRVPCEASVRNPYDVTRVQLRLDFGWFILFQMRKRSEQLESFEHQLKIRREPHKALGPLFENSKQMIADIASDLGGECCGTSVPAPPPADRNPNLCAPYATLQDF